MYNEETIKIIKRIIYAIIIGSILTIVLKFYLGCAADIKKQNNISCGIVTNKETVYQKATYFRDSTTEYILYFEGEYTNAFDKQSAYTKKIYVDEETYKYYNVGDFFDYKNVIATEEKE
ncbi:MAG: hypothetical protein HDR29_00030 [Lachnospiraceae bacterium]|nr:hypothetical protein [Lachnospiraceae bacterium]